MCIHRGSIKVTQSYSVSLYSVSLLYRSLSSVAWHVALFVIFATSLFLIHSCVIIILEFYLENPNGLGLHIHV